MTSRWKRWKGKRAYAYISIPCTLASWCRLGCTITKKHFRIFKCIPSKTYMSLSHVADVYFRYDMQSNSVQKVCFICHVKILRRALCYISSFTQMLPLPLVTTLCICYALRPATTMQEFI